MSEERETSDPVAAGTRGRLLSLDVLRGLTVIGMIVVNSAAGLQSSAKVFPTLLHSHWDGITLADIVFPGFLMMVGVSIPLALGKDPSRRRIMGRTLRLLLLGFILSNLWWFSDFSATTMRVPGVLQRIGLAYGACALLFLMCGPKVRMAIIAAILLLYWPLALLPALDGLPNDIWLRGHNFIGSVDRVLLGEFIYVKGPEGYDPEGILGTLPSIAQGLIGVAIGEYLLANRDKRIAGRLAIAGLAMLIAGIGWGFVFPIVKDIWSSSFVLATCGITTLALAGLHLWLDRREDAPGSGLIAIIALPFGINAIAAYVVHQLTGSMPGWSLLMAPFEATREAIGDRLASLIPILLYVLFIWACMYPLMRKRWIIKI